MKTVANVIEDSVSEWGQRITTFEITYPRIILAEINTHKICVSNSSSSRAIPVAKLLELVRNQPFIPSQFGKNQPGMVSGEWETKEDMIYANNAAERIWREAKDSACRHAEDLMKIGVHKELVNRIIEPYSYTSTILTATEWDNFFTLRTASDAQPQFQELAKLMQAAYIKSKPVKRNDHIPYRADIPDNASWKDAFNYSAARCGRVSYLNHGKDMTLAEGLEFADNRLLKPRHMSPFQHQAFATEESKDKWSAQFRGWNMWRKVLEGDVVPYKPPTMEKREDGALVFSYPEKELHSNSFVPQHKIEFNLETEKWEAKKVDVRYKGTGIVGDPQ